MKTRTSIVIPTYWGRNKKEGWREGDLVFDHPTPLDGEGTLGRALESLKVLENRDFEVIVISVPTNKDIEERVDENVRRIIKGVAHGDVKIHSMGPSILRVIKDEIRRIKPDIDLDLLDLKGYSDVRNLCLFAAHLLGSEVAVLIDDDEVIDDPRYLSKAREYIGTRHNNSRILGVAGYYLNPDGDYHISKPSEPWMRFWDKNAALNEAFDRFIGRGPRLKITPFAFGGNMVIHRDLFMKIPFDPLITRGEDIDYLINARIFGFDLYLDNNLMVKHLPPPKSHPTWMRIRQDIYRFTYERAKLRCQDEPKMARCLNAEELDPYPGRFLKDDLEYKVEKAAHMLSQDYLERGDEIGSRESLRNIVICREEAQKNMDPFHHLQKIQRDWMEIMEFTKGKDLLIQ